MLNWIKSAAGSTVLGSLIALGGVYIGLDQSKDLWIKNTRVDQFVRITDRRIEIIGDMAMALTNAQRAKMLDDLIDKHNKELELEARLCFDDQNRQQNEYACNKMMQDDLDVLSVYSQHAQMQSDYLSAFALADVYFCGETKGVLKSIEDSVEVWWTISREQQGELLRAMKNEVRCQLDTEELLD